MVATRLQCFSRCGCRSTVHTCHRSIKYYIKFVCTAPPAKRVTKAIFKFTSPQPPSSLVMSCVRLPVVQRPTTCRHLLYYGQPDQLANQSDPALYVSSGSIQNLTRFRPRHYTRRRQQTKQPNHIDSVASSLFASTLH